MQSSNVALFTGVILCFREYLLPFQMQWSNATLCTGIVLCFREYIPTHISKCKEQMQHYLLGILYALKNAPFPNAKHKCDIIYWGYFMLKRIPRFQNPKYTCDFICWDYVLFKTIPPPLSKCKVQMRNFSWFYFMLIIKYLFLSKYKGKSDII